MSGLGVVADGPFSVTIFVSGQAARLTNFDRLLAAHSTALHASEKEPTAKVVIRDSRGRLKHQYRAGEVVG